MHFELPGLAMNSHFGSVGDSALALVGMTAAPSTNAASISAKRNRVHLVAAAILHHPLACNNLLAAASPTRRSI
jgi:hypothetical protein